MLDRVIELSLKNRVLVVLVACGLGAWGWWAAVATPVDAIPDLSDNQVIVFTEWSGHSAREVEDQVSYPLTVNLQGLPGVRVVRSQSAFGFSMIYVIFEDAIDQYFARARVLERLSLVSTLLPEGTTPTLGPDATGVGHVFWYTVESDRHSLRDLRAVQDWFVRYQLNAVPGVAEVASIGGFVRQYQIEVSSTKMRAANVSLQEVMRAVSDSNLNVGGKVIEENGMEVVVRGLGLVKSAGDLENIVLTETNGMPVYLRDVATIQIGGDFRRGTLDVNGREVVGGIVVMRTGENSRDVIRQVQRKIEQIAPALPPGITIRSFYDRSELIERTLGTLKFALWEEVLLVTLAHILFLWHFRSILIVTLPLPMSILASFTLMKYFGISSNIMSLSGIAIAIGVLVDAAIVMTENVIRHCEEAEKNKGAAQGAGTAKLTASETLTVVLEASRQVGRPIFFAMTIIILA